MCVAVPLATATNNYKLHRFLGTCNTWNISFNILWNLNEKIWGKWLGFIYMQCIECMLICLIIQLIKNNFTDKEMSHLCMYYTDTSVDTEFLLLPADSEPSLQDSWNEFTNTVNTGSSASSQYSLSREHSQTSAEVTLLRC